MQQAAERKHITVRITSRLLGKRKRLTEIYLFLATFPMAVI
jgi:hypothetical protein